MRWLFYLTILGLLLGQFARIPLTHSVAITFLDLSVFVFISTWLIRKAIKRENFSTTLTKPLIFFVLVCFLSLLVNIFRFAPLEILIGGLYLLRWIVYACVFFAVRDLSPEVKKTIPIVVYIVTAIHVIIGLLQYFFYPDLSKLYHLGWDEHLYRLFGSLLDPNYQGALYVLLFTYIFVYTFHSKKQSEYLRYGSYFLLVFLLIAIVLTYSRSALIMLLGSLITYGLLTGKKKIIALITSGIILLIILFSNVYIEGLNPLRTASSFARITSMKEAVSIIQKNPVFGVGFNTYRYAQNEYGFRTSDYWMVSHADAGTDNSYLFILATTGIIGLSIYLLLLRSLFTIAKQKNNQEIPMQLILKVSLIGLLINCLFINSLFYPMLMYWMWTLVGLTENT